MLRQAPGNGQERGSELFNARDLQFCAFFVLIWDAFAYKLHSVVLWVRRAAVGAFGRVNSSSKILFNCGHIEYGSLSRRCVLNVSAGFGHVWWSNAASNEYQGFLPEERCGSICAKFLRLRESLLVLLKYIQCSFQNLIWYHDVTL